MKRIVMLLGGILVLGVGCAQAPEPPAMMEEKAAFDLGMTKPPAMMEEKDTSELVLTAEALGSGKVKFTWEAPTGLTEANRFILVEGTEENPIHDGKHNWFRQYYANRAVVWAERSAGSTHYRLCLTENNDMDTCTTYSNDVTVNVQ